MAGIPMKRLYDSLAAAHLAEHDEMLFISGPRQVGKTTVCKKMASLGAPFAYLNWDDEDHRRIIMKGPTAIRAFANCQTISAAKPIIVFDEIHKRPEWKNFLKGLYDSYADKICIVVCGSARLDVYQKGGDSLMGRYFAYRMHPISVAESLTDTMVDVPIREPSQLAVEVWDALYIFGGFPKPFLKRDSAFSTRWQHLRMHQLLREDIRDVNMIHDLNRFDILVDLLKQRAAQQLTYAKLAKFVRVTGETIARWIEILETFYFCFQIRPWTHNISRSLLKEPKVFLWDWSVVEDAGAKAENFIASHLLKAVHCWTDRGLGDFQLYYIRTRDQKEVDFVVTKNGKAWFLVEVKLSEDQAISPHLGLFQKSTGAMHAFQVVIEMPYVERDCFQYTDPVIVPAKTFLSQLA